MAHYTFLNQRRMHRLNKTTNIEPVLLKQLLALKRNYLWLVITEAWCGDAAQVIPVLNQLSLATPKIELKLIMRDEHLELMDAYLTDGSRSIPKLIVVDKDSGEVMGSWGPRPAEAQKLVLDNKHAANPLPYSEFLIILQRWYNKDKTLSIQAELLLQLMAWENQAE